MSNAAGARTRASAGTYQAYFGITSSSVEAFVRRRLGLLIQVHGAFNTGWGQPAMMALAEDAINEDEYLTKFFDRLNHLSPALDLTSRTKPTAAHPKQGWTLFATYVGDTRDKLHQIYTKAGMSWPPTPMGSACTMPRVGRRPIVAPVAAVATVPRAIDPNGTTVFHFFIVDPDTAPNPLAVCDDNDDDDGDDDDDDDSAGGCVNPPAANVNPSDKPADMYAWRHPDSVQWLQSMQNSDAKSLFALIERILPKVAPERHIRVIYGATCNLASTNQFPTDYADPGLMTGAMQNLSDDEQFRAWFSVTAHLDQPLGVGIYLKRKPGGPPDSPTYGRMPHLDQHALIAEAHPSEEEYPYDSEAEDVNSKSRKRVGKPRSVEGYIKAMGRYGRRIRQSRWMLTKLILWANNHRYGPQPGMMSDNICFPTEACWRPRMNIAQHRQEKARYISMGRNDAAYKAFVADPANAATYDAASGFPREVACDEEHSS